MADLRKLSGEPNDAFLSRIDELDLLRGFALFGIIAINIISMAHPVEAYLNPFAILVSELTFFNQADWHDGGLLNMLIFAFNDIFINQKMMGLFSLLFGASTLLFISSLKAKGQGSKYYFIRNFWLIIFGLFHSFLLFEGDILFIYGICALGLYWFTYLRPAWQFALGIMIYCIPIVQQFNMQLSLNDFSTEQLQQLNFIWHPFASYLKETVAYTLSLTYSEWVMEKISIAVSTDGYGEYGELVNWYYNTLVIEGFLRAFGMMLIGMAFLSWGVLPNRKTRKPSSFYWTLFKMCMAIGLSLTAIGFGLNYYFNWNAQYSMLGGRLLNHIAAPFMSCAYLSLLILWSMKQRGLWSERLKPRLQAVGRMALTNYIIQSTYGLLLFSNVGFGHYGQLHRLELLLLVILLCLFQLWFSSLWLQRFHYGPLEWLWRSLTFFRFARLR